MGTIGSNEVRVNLHELVPEPGLWERITTVGANNDGNEIFYILDVSLFMKRKP